jgi:hypothetical protein
VFHHGHSGNLKSGMNIAIFWAAASCNLVDGYQGFRGKYCLYLLPWRWRQHIPVKHSEPNYTMSQLRRWHSSEKSVDFSSSLQVLSQNIVISSIQTFCQCPWEQETDKTGRYVIRSSCSRLLITCNNHKEHPEMGKDGFKCINLNKICHNIAYPFWINGR